MIRKSCPLLINLVGRTAFPFLRVDFLSVSRGNARLPLPLLLYEKDSLPEDARRAGESPEKEELTRLMRSSGQSLFIQRRVPEFFRNR